MPKFFEPVKLVHATATRTHHRTAALGRLHHREQSRINSRQRRKNQQPILAATFQRSLNEPEGKAGADLMPIQPMQPAALRDNLHRHARRHLWRCMEQIPVRLLDERFCPVEFCDGDRQAGPEALAVDKFVGRRQRLPDDAVLGQRAIHLQPAEHKPADHAAYQQDPNHQPEHAEQQIRLAVHRSQAHEEHHRAVDQAGEREVEGGATTHERRAGVGDGFARSHV